MARQRRNPKAFQLRFGHTSARKYAPTMKQAVADARYWLGFGQTRICIYRRGPNDATYAQVRCLTRRRR
jgi:hypothetical protein